MFWEASILFFIAAIPSYILINSTQGSNFFTSCQPLSLSIFSSSPTVGMRWFHCVFPWCQFLFLDLIPYLQSCSLAVALNKSVSFLRVFVFQVYHSNFLLALYRFWRPKTFLTACYKVSFRQSVSTWSSRIADSGEWRWESQFSLALECLLLRAIFEVGLPSYSEYLLFFVCEYLLRF